MATCATGPAHHTWRRRRAARLIAALSWSLVVPCGTGAAMDITVTRVDDPSPSGCTPADCSLREAVILANALIGADTIHLAAGAYQLTIAGAGEDLAATGDLDVRDDVSIVGAGSGLTSIVMTGQYDRVIQLYYDANAGIVHTLNLTGLSISGGYVHKANPFDLASLGSGGCVYAVGAANLLDVVIGNCQADEAGGLYLGYGQGSSLQDVTVSANTAADFAGGAEIVGYVPAVLHGLTVTDNHVTGYDMTNPAQAGGLYLYMSGGGSVDHVTVSGNTAQVCGGAVLAVEGNAQLSAFTISANTALQYGGGLCLSQTIHDVSADLDGFTVQGNHADGDGGGVYVNLLADFPINFAMRFHHSEFSGNIAGYGNNSGSGGAIAFALCDGCDNAHTRSLGLQDSSVHDNEAHTHDGAATPGGFGGGVFSQQPLTVVRSSFSANSADRYGGAVALSSPGPGSSGVSVFQSSTFNANATTATSGATGGGALFVTLTMLDLIGDTFDANASLFGGVLYNTGAQVNFSQDTLYRSSSNPAGAIGTLIAAYANVNATTATMLVNTLLVGTCSGVAPTAAVGDMEAGNGFTNSCNLTGSSTANVATQNLHLAALADNGGPTLTRLPGVGSYAIGAADASQCLPYDQRGFVRIDLDVCDVGAVQTGASDVIFASGFELN